MKKYPYKHFIWIILLFILILPHQPALRAENYPTHIQFTIYYQNQIIGQDDFFEILDLEDYILVPLVSFSRWLDIELHYSRENELLTVYYGEQNESLALDLAHNIYYDFPGWSSEPPIALEGDFYVTASLIEYLTGARLEWDSRRLELILDYDHKTLDKSELFSDKNIIKIPELSDSRPIIKGPDFSLGSIQYKINFDYKFDDDSEDLSLYSRNLFNIHGRIEDWSLSAVPIIDYNFNTEEYSFYLDNFKAQNPEDNRLIILGDSRFTLPSTLGRVNLRGLYVQYPFQQISDRRAYTSVWGEAEEGNTVYLFVNDRQVDRKYIDYGELHYHFINVPLTVNRTNIIRILIENDEGQETEIVKKVTGSLYLYEKNTSEAVLGLGHYKRSTPPRDLLETLGAQFKYAPAAGTSLFWEIGGKKIYNNSDYKGVQVGSLMRIALRPEDLPLVFYADWLAGNEVNLIEHGVRASTLYTRQNGHIEASVSYIPPIAAQNVSFAAGQQLMVNLQQELNDSWLLDIILENSGSLDDMVPFERRSAAAVFDYKDSMRNTFTIGVELADRIEDILWRDLSLKETSRNWLELHLKGRTFPGTTMLGGEVVYILSDIEFFETENSGKIPKKQDELVLVLNISENLTEDLMLSGGFKSSFTWLDELLLYRDYQAIIRSRLKVGDNTFITAGYTAESDLKRNLQGQGTIEDTHKLELFLRHSSPSNFVFTAGIKNIFEKQESYFTGTTGFSYKNTEQDWQIAADLEYLAPEGNRKSPQEKVSIEFNKHLFSGLEGSINLSRSYASKASEKPIHQISLTFSQVLSFTPGNIIGQKYQRGDHNSNISGFVYLDLNGNGKKDPEDPPVEGVTITRDRSSTVTDENGYFIFENTRAGSYEVGLNRSNLADEYKILTENKVVHIRDNENIFLEFTLTKKGSLSGELYIDGTTEQENIADLSLDRVGLTIKELNKTIFTHSDGSFYTDNLPLGSYTLNIMEDSLPPEVKIAGEASLQIDITPENLFVKDIIIPLIY